MFPNYFHRKLQWWAAIGQAAGEIGTGYLNYRSQTGANKTNVKLQQQDEAWQTQMSNTAVQRRADDIEKAGGNRALAFTNGQEASTPSIAPAHVEPVHYDAPHISNAILAAAQLRNIEADTQEKTASAVTKQVQARIDAATERQRTDYTSNHYVEAHDWDDAKTQIMRNQVGSSAAETKKLEGTVDQVIDMAKQQARTGQINLDALERIAKLGGVDAAAWSKILATIGTLIIKGVK